MSKKDPLPQADPGDERSLALELLLDAWDSALDEGVNADVLATTAIFAALTDMIDLHGEEMAVQMIETLPARIRAGEFTLTTRN